MFNVTYCPTLLLFFLFTGRREFVQRLKLEATLNVHDGCVSVSLFSLLQENTHQVGFPLVGLVDRSLTSGQIVNAPEKPEADKQSHVLLHYQPGRHSVQNNTTITADRQRGPEKRVIIIIIIMIL